MNAVELKVLKSTPATIQFNDEAISVYLDGLLEKYEGMVFTDETSTDCRKTISELNKLSKGINKFRLDRKKELIAEVSGFEDKCKALVSKVDTTVAPLKEQLQAFDEAAAAEKLKLATGYILEAIETYQLKKKFADQLVPRADVTNRSTSKKKVMEGVFEDAKTLKKMQEAEHAKIEMVKAWIELKNVEFELAVKMHYSEFESLVDQELDYIKGRILDTATSRQISEFEAMEKVRKEAEAKAQREAEAKIQAELEERMAKERAEQAEKDRLADIERKKEEAKRAEERRQAELEAKRIQEEADKKVAEAQAQTAAVAEVIDQVVPEQAEAKDELKEVTLKITGTSNQLKALRTYMERYEIGFEKVTETF